MTALYLTRSLGQPKASDLYDEDLIDLVCFQEIGVHPNLEEAQKALKTEASKMFGGEEVNVEWNTAPGELWRMKATATHGGFFMEFYGSIQVVNL